MLHVEILEEFSTRRTSFADSLCPVDLQFVAEVHEYLTMKDVSDWSLGRAHIKTLCTFSCVMFRCNGSLSVILCESQSADVITCVIQSI